MTTVKYSFFSDYLDSLTILTFSTLALTRDEHTF